MEYIQQQNNASLGTILCCKCGVSIAPNPANMCVGCLQSEVDITEGIPKSATLYFCRNCERYLQPPSQWISAALESRELLAVCLKKLKSGLSKVRLVDAGFIWTEPHSKRIKMKLAVQKEVNNGAILQQNFVVEFTVNNQMCNDCHKVEAKDYWKAVVQLRQKASHKKTFFYLEQMMLKHQAHSNTVNIKENYEGLDFFFAQKNDARKLTEFIQQVVPCRYKTAQELVSHDVHNNTYVYKYTYSVEIVPICKDNIVCLSTKMAQSLGNISQICICHRVTQTLHIIDPNTLQVAEISGTTFWRDPFKTLCAPKDFTEYIIMQLEFIEPSKHRHPLSTKHVLAEVWVVKASEIGSDEGQYFCKTHLGHLLNVGDSVLGYDLRFSNVNDANLEKMSPDRIPDVVIVKKVYADKAKRNRKRNWKLRHMDRLMEGSQTSSIENQYTDFLEDLEEDPDLRHNVNIYKDTNKIAVDQDDTDDENVPTVSLQEMLDDLHISTDATGEEGAEMQE
ncbi:unnamed protein product [Owenia fusiformis]|uniref:60S ribosomal export protein NMD3 n=1 Tax=Owenia fusiformis TaxID=6347 RepID=A0A8J1UUL0_OWEFU|nr:unnamed protein product [Owenia fusiformis]